MKLNPSFLKMCALSALFVLIAVGCGKKEEDAPIVAAGVAVGTCQAGYGYTSYGCMPQGQCQSGYANYNNSCVPTQVQPGNGGVSAICQGSCQAGYVQTQMGCLPSAPQACGNSCAGLSGSWCYPGRRY